AGGVQHRAGRRSARAFGDPAALPFQWAHRVVSHVGLLPSRRPPQRWLPARAIADTTPTCEATERIPRDVPWPARTADPRARQRRRDTRGTPRGERERDATRARTDRCAAARA